MTILSLAAVPKVNRAGVPVGGTYSAAECLAALNAHRYETFRYEQHRVVSGAWTVIADLTERIHSAVIKYDRWQTGAMRTAEIELVDDPVFGTTINDLGDAIRCFRQLRMPDGAYAEWMRGTFYVPSPDVPLQGDSIARLRAPDALWTVVNGKLDDWLTVPATPDMATFWGHVDDLDDPIRWVRSLLAHYFPLAGLDIGDDPDEKRVPAASPLSYRPGDALLDVVNDLLYYAGHDQLVANVTGSLISNPFVPPSALPTEISYVATSPDLLPTAGCFLVRRSWKWRRNNFEAFNKWTGVVSAADVELAYTKELSDPGNPLSTFTRPVVHEFFYTRAPDAATLQAQVEAKYEEGQRVLATLDGEIAAMPHDHRDKIAVSWPSQPWGPLADATYIVKGWEEPMKAGAPMTLHLEQSPLTAADLRAPSPRVAHLRTTGRAPTVAISVTTSAVPGVDSLTITRYAPFVDLGPVLVTPDVAALATATLAPAITVGVSAVPDVDALVTTGLAPVVALGVVPGALALVLAEYAPDLGGVAPYVWESIWELFDANADPVDALLSIGSYRVFVYYGSHDAVSWKAATNADYTVPGGKSLIVLRWLTNRSVPIDFTQRKVRLENVTDATDVLADSDFRDATIGELNWQGDGGSTTQILPVVAAGKRVRLEVWNGNTVKRAMGGLVICREV